MIQSPRCLLLAVLLTVASPVAADESPLFPNADFETGTLAGWTVDGDAFAVQPTKGDNPAARGRESAGMQGVFWIGGYEQRTAKVGEPGATRGDEPTGTLTSPEFTVTKPYVTFLIGGGNLPDELGVKLVSEDDELSLGTGVDSETMVRRSVDVTKFKGRKARFVVFDKATGGWGHLNVDDFTATDEPVRDTSRDFAFTGDISAAAYPETRYDQPLRPQFHFTSRKNWLNDPNGMVFDGEQYHLFFQHNPKGTAWGNMTWGHATSPDMLRWTQHDHALLPYRIDGRSGTIFSGTAVVDFNDSLGKQVGETKTICAFFTFASQPKFYQAMAYSTDGGESFTYWNEGRPVVENQGFDSGERDPKVFWHAASQQWVMVLWVQSDPGRVRWFTSRNLVDWEFASDLMRDWAFECMDVVFLPVDGDEKNVKCVIYDASFDYEVGTFDGKAFHAETTPLKAGRGNFYAAQTFNQAPEGRAVQMGWMRGGPNSAERFDVPHNQQMSFPCELTLRTTAAGPRLFCWPVKEIESLVREEHQWDETKLAAGVNLLGELGPLDLVDLEITFSPGTAKALVFDLPHAQLTYDCAKHVLTHIGVNDEGRRREDTTVDEIAPRDGRVTLRLLVDRLSVEAYAFGGETFGAHYTFPPNDVESSIHAVGGTATVHELTLRELKSAWPRRGIDRRE